MVGRIPAGAVSEYVATIQRVVSCISDAVVSVEGGYYVSDIPHLLRLNRGRPVRLGGTSRLWLTFQQYYRIVEVEVPRVQWTVAVEGYEYKLLDADSREVLTYHWHPRGQSPIVFQHLHVGHGAEVGRSELQTAHLPTGHVSAADIIRLLIGDFGATPSRRDWEDALRGFRT